MNISLKTEKSLIRSSFIRMISSIDEYFSHFNRFLNLLLLFKIYSAFKVSKIDDIFNALYLIENEVIKVNSNEQAINYIIDTCFFFVVWINRNILLHSWKYGYNKLLFVLETVENLANISQGEIAFIRVPRHNNRRLLSWDNSLAVFTSKWGHKRNTIDTQSMCKTGKRQTTLKWIKTAF